MIIKPELYTAFKCPYNFPFVPDRRHKTEGIKLGTLDLALLFSNSF